MTTTRTTIRQTCTTGRTCRIVKTGAPDLVLPGDVLVYTLTYIN